MVEQDESRVEEFRVVAARKQESGVWGGHLYSARQESGLGVTETEGRGIAKSRVSNYSRSESCSKSGS